MLQVYRTINGGFLQRIFANPPPDLAYKKEKISLLFFMGKSPLFMIIGSLFSVLCAGSYYSRSVASDSSLSLVS